MKHAKRDSVARSIVERIIRIRHFRGHGVHSPYVYNIVRRVFMCKKLIDNQETLFFEQLLTVTNKTIAIELQNIATVCRYKCCKIDPKLSEIDCDFIIYTSRTPINSIEVAIESAKNSGATIVIIQTKEDNNYEQLYNDVDRDHPSTTIKRSSYLLIFNNHLPKQRFIL